MDQIDDQVQGLWEMTWIDYMCQEKTDKEHSPVLKIMSNHQYEESKTT